MKCRAQNGSQLSLMYDMHECEYRKCFTHAYGDFHLPNVLLPLLLLLGGASAPLHLPHNPPPPPCFLSSSTSAGVMARGRTVRIAIEGVPGLGSLSPSLSSLSSLQSLSPAPMPSGIHGSAHGGQRSSPAAPSSNSPALSRSAAVNLSRRWTLSTPVGGY